MAIPNGYKEVLTSPRATRNVEAYWSFLASESGSSLVLPDGRCDVILQFNIYKSDPPVTIVTGPATRPFSVEHEDGDSWLGMRFRPHDGVVLWSKDIVDSVDTVVRGDDALKRLSKLAEFKDSHLTVENFADSLKPRTPRKTDCQLTKALDAIHASGGRIRVDRLSSMVGYTHRQLNRVFRSNLGISTKTYTQLVQFHRTLKLIHVEQLKISDAAIEGGYSDHAHLTRAFVRFGGFRPSQIPQNLSIPVLSP